VFANRTGIEEEAVYAGISAVLGIQAGEVKVYGILGRGEKERLVVDTNKRPQTKLVSEPNSSLSGARQATGSDKSGHSMYATEMALPSSELNKLLKGEVVTPLSPADPMSPRAFFSSEEREADEKTFQKYKSSITKTELPDKPNSPTLRRPQSPKSRNASRTRHLEQHKLPLGSHSVANDGQVSQIVLGVGLPLRSAPTAADQNAPPRPKSAVW
jgi:protein N-terminal amidase